MPRDSEIQQLLAICGALGIDERMLVAAADEIVALSLRIAELERQRDPRKAETAELARRVGRAHAALAGNDRAIAILCERFGRSRSRIHVLINFFKLSCVTQDTSSV